MNAPKVLALLLALSPAASGTSLKWEGVYNGAAAGFDWAHQLSLDAAGGILYVSGKSSEAYAGYSKYSTWTLGRFIDSGDPTWSVARSTMNFGGSGNGSIPNEELAEAGAVFPGGGVLQLGRYSSSANQWHSFERILNPSGSVLSLRTIAGGVHASGFRPPIRGVGAAGLDKSAGGWGLMLRRVAGSDGSGLPPVEYLFQRYFSVLLATKTFSFPPLDVDPGWAGDCCYDPPARLASDDAGNVYSLAGSRYNEISGSFGFSVVKVTPAGNKSVWTYHGTAGGLNVADALVAAPDGNVFVLAKTSETAAAYGSRLLAFNSSGILRWSRDLAWKGQPFQDAALALSPMGRLWVVESRSGRALCFDAAGEQLSKAELPFDKAASYYVGHLLADEKTNLYLSGTKNGDAWVAKFDAEGVDGPRPSCILTNAFNYPNPFDSRIAQTKIRFELYEAASVKVSIYDLAGRQVKRWEIAGAQGANELSWDGSGDGGGKVVQGMYLAHLKTSPSVCDAIIRIGVRH